MRFEFYRWQSTNCYHRPSNSEGDSPTELSEEGEGDDVGSDAPDDEDSEGTPAFPRRRSFSPPEIVFLCPPVTMPTELSPNPPPVVLHPGQSAPEAPSNDLMAATQPPDLQLKSEYGGFHAYYSLRPRGARVYNVLNALPPEPLASAAEDKILECHTMGDEHRIMHVLWGRWISVNR